MKYHKISTDNFCFEAGGTLSGLEIVFHTSDREYRPGDKVVWICHALTANSDVENWWPQLVGPGLLVDTQKYFVVCVNMLGSAYGSAGPATTDPGTGKPFYFTFPKVTIRDMAAACTIVRKHLGIGSIDLLIGSSIGGFNAIEIAAGEPDVVKNAIFIATAPRISPWLSAQAEAQRMALEADPSFRECASLEGGKAGLECARAQGLITYRSYDGYCLTQAEEDPDTLFASRAASYERYQGHKLTARGFDAYSYYSLCNSLDSHNVGRGRGGVDAALGRITARTIVVSVDSDGIFPPEEGRRWASAINGCEFHVITSRFGHDGFLLENDQLSAIFRTILP